MVHNYANPVANRCVAKKHFFLLYTLQTSILALSTLHHSAKATCEIRFESRRWRPCSGAIVMISGVTSLPVLLPPLGSVPTEEQFVEAESK